MRFLQAYVLLASLFVGSYFVLMVFRPTLSMPLSARAEITDSAIKITANAQPFSSVHAYTSPSLGSPTESNYLNSGSKGQVTFTFPRQPSHQGTFAIRLTSYSSSPYFRYRGKADLPLSLPKKAFLQVSSCERFSSDSFQSSVSLLLSSGPITCALSPKAEIRLTLQGLPGSQILIDGTPHTFSPQGSGTFTLSLAKAILALPTSVLFAPERFFSSTSSFSFGSQPSLSIDLPLSVSFEQTKSELTLSFFPTAYDLRRLLHLLLAQAIAGQIPLPFSPSAKALLFAESAHSWKTVGSPPSLADIRFFASQRTEKTRSLRPCGPYHGALRYAPQLATDVRVEIRDRSGASVASKVFSARPTPCPRVLTFWRRRGSAASHTIQHTPPSKGILLWLESFVASSNPNSPHPPQDSDTP